jgi:hypothetical protein
MTTKLMITPVKIAVHRIDDNPIFGENVIHVSVDDDSGGAYIVIEANEGQMDGLRIDLDELEMVLVAAKILIAGIPPEN